jgi:hypothetical protein
MPRHRLGSGFMFASARSGVGPDGEAVNKGVRLDLYSLDCLAPAPHP